MSEPTANSPEDLGWTPQATGREPLRFPIPPSTPASACRTCKARIFWIVTTSAKRMPVDPDGVSHFSTCPEAAQHRKPKAPPPPPLTAKQVNVLRSVYEGVPIAVRSDNRFALSDLERRKLIVLEHGIRWRTTPEGEKALERAKGRK